MSRESTRLGRMLEKFTAGEMPPDEVSDFFRDYQFPPRAAEASNGWTEYDLEFVDGSWDEVAVAHAAGRITDEQYAALVHAVETARHDDGPAAPG